MSAGGVVVALAQGTPVFPSVSTFWWLLAADAICVGGGVILIPFASRHIGSGELAMILLGEIAACVCQCNL